MPLLIQRWNSWMPSCMHTHDRWQPSPRSTFPCDGTVPYVIEWSGCPPVAPKPSRGWEASALPAVGHAGYGWRRNGAERGQVHFSHTGMVTTPSIIGGRLPCSGAGWRVMLAPAFPDSNSPALPSTSCNAAVERGQVHFCHTGMVRINQFTFLDAGSAKATRRPTAPAAAPGPARGGT